MRDFWGNAYIENNIGDFSVGHWIANSFGDEVKPHVHTDAHLIVITGGKFVTEADGKAATPLIIYNPPNTFHRDHFDSDLGSFFTISISPNLINETPEIVLPQIPTVISNPLPQAIANKIMRECVNQQKDSSLIIESFCFEILGAIGDYCVPRNIPKWLKTAFEVLQDCYTQELSINNLSREIGVHPIHLTRTFQTFYGCTPGEFLRNRRLQKAAELLVSSKLSITEIALESGFFDQSHLTKHFHRTFGLPPGKFRNLTNVCFIQDQKHFANL